MRDWEVRALREGRKTQTRRPVALDLGPETHSPRLFEDGLWRWMTGVVCYNAHEIRCPYGVPGDRLYVRETWGLWDTEPSDGPDRAEVFYRATEGQRHDLRHQLWRSSTQMPPWASRTVLEVVSVRVERLQAITEEDAIAEGCHGHGWHRHPTLGICTDDGELPSEEFRWRWEERYAKRNLGWDFSPWLWVIEHREVKR